MQLEERLSPIDIVVEATQFHRCRRAQGPPGHLQVSASTQHPSTQPEAVSDDSLLTVAIAWRVIGCSQQYKRKQLRTS